MSCENIATSMQGLWCSVEAVGMVWFMIDVMAKSSDAVVIAIEPTLQPMKLVWFVT